MSKSQSYDEKFKTKLVGYASSDGGSSSKESDSDASVTDQPTKKQRFTQSSAHNRDSESLFSHLNEDLDNDSVYKCRDPNFAKEEFSHPIFELDRSLNKNNFNPSKQGTNRRERPKASEQELLVFGYASKLFDLKEGIENGFVDLESEGVLADGNSVPNIWLRRSIFNPKITLDRFDVRNLCDTVSGSTALATWKQPSEHPLDRVRYASLDPDEHRLFDMSEKEREEFIDKRNRTSDLRQNKSKMYGYDYEKKSIPNPQEDIEFSFPVPEGMAVPSSHKQLLVIERTAKFIISSKDPLLEVKIQGRHGNLPEFGFLNRDNCLHEFFQKVKTLIKLGLYSYCETEATSEKLAEDKQPDANQPKFVPAPPPEERINQPSIPSDQMHFISLFAKTSAFKGPTFEQKFRVGRSSTPEFAFLLPWNKAHAYYLSQLEQARNHDEGDKYKELNLVFPSTEFEINQLVSILSQQVTDSGAALESLVYAASLRCTSLDFVFPWSSLNKYYSWKKQKLIKDAELCDYLEDPEELVATQVSFRGVEFERELQTKLCLDRRFAFLMPWDPQHAGYRERVASITPTIPAKVEDCTVMTRFAQTFAIHGPNLEHQIRSLFFKSPDFSFLLPWGPGYPQYLELLARELMHKRYQPRRISSPPADLLPFIDQLALPSNAVFRLALLLNPDNPLASVRYGHAHFDYFAARINYSPPNSTAVEGTSSEGLQSLFNHQPILDLPLESVALVSSMELCSWLQAKFPWFGLQLQHCPELPFLCDGHPLHGKYNHIVHAPAEDISHSACGCFFPDAKDKLIIDALARLASLSGLEFQQFKSVEFTEAFPFLQPAHVHHPYYRWKAAYPNCDAGDSISPSPEQSALINTTAAFAVRHGASLESLLWSRSPTSFAFLGTASESHSFYTRKKDILSKSPLETYPTQPPTPSSCSNEYIDKIALLVSEMSPAFEAQIYLDYPEKLGFIHPCHPNHAYYTARLNEIRSPIKERGSSQPPMEPPSELTELQKKRLARVKKLLYK
ncbi:hypothetical protein DSO57_1007110 [Entomophthora muscae]|uniref:Uncharacterized protein n=3 Tax=Entomophthora muscae TaxID=34485 RepID=A0ACC2TUU3_9FUNG|nr:hypothetical protein DSO57_1007110 [Entomophthora muscae]